MSNLQTAIEGLRRKEAGKRAAEAKPVDTDREYAKKSADAKQGRWPTSGFDETTGSQRTS